MSEKFRSIDAFRSYEQRAPSPISPRSKDDGPAAVMEAPKTVSPLRVLAAVKRHPAGIRVGELASDLAVSRLAISEALLHLLNEEMVHLEPGDASGDDLVLP